MSNDIDLAKVLGFLTENIITILHVTALSTGSLTHGSAQWARNGFAPQNGYIIGAIIPPSTNAMARMLLHVPHEELVTRSLAYGRIACNPIAYLSDECILHLVCYMLFGTAGCYSTWFAGQANANLRQGPIRQLGQKA